MMRGNAHAVARKVDAAIIRQGADILQQFAGAIDPVQLQHAAAGAHSIRQRTGCGQRERVEAGDDTSLEALGNGDGFTRQAQRSWIERLGEQRALPHVEQQPVLRRKYRTTFR
jgi:hypothetical protein